MRRICLVCLCLLFMLSLPVLAETAEETSDILYTPANTQLPTFVTYHGEKETAAFASGRVNNALALDGNEFLSTDISELVAPFTLSAWVYAQSDIADQRIFTLQKANSENFISLSASTESAVVGKAEANGITLLTSCFKDGQFLYENYYHPTISGVSEKLPTESWHHVALTVEENAVTVYIDGVVWQTASLPFTYTELGATTLYIGNKPDGLGGFIGKMEAVTLHKTVLDGVAVARLAQDIPPEDTETVVTVQQYAAATLPAIETLQQTKAVITNNEGAAVISSDTIAFWENPQIATGQTITGTLTVKGGSKTPVSMQLATITLPAKDTPAYAYLSEINVLIQQDGAVLYDGPYTALSASNLPLRWTQLPNERQYTYTVTLSRPFTSTLQPVAVNVPWQWESAAFPIANNPLKKTDTSVWLLLVLVVSTVAVSFSLYWALICRPRRIFTVWDTVFENIRKKFR